MAEKENVIFPIEYAGFRVVDDDSFEIVKQNVERHSRKLSVKAKKINNIHLTLKKLHEREKGEIYDIHARLKDNGKIYVSHCSDRNLFAAVDKALQKLVNEMG